MSKRAIVILAGMLLAACGGSLAATPHPTPNPTVDPTEVTLALTQEAIYAATQEAGKAEYESMLDATYEAESIREQEELDLDTYVDLLVECAEDGYLRTPPYPRATATAKAATCTAQLLPYQSKHATQTALAATPTPHQ